VTRRREDKTEEDLNSYKFKKLREFHRFPEFITMMQPQA
jgi:hypothetical protein